MTFLTTIDSRASSSHSNRELDRALLEPVTVVPESKESDENEIIELIKSFFREGYFCDVILGSAVIMAVCAFVIGQAIIPTITTFVAVSLFVGICQIIIDSNPLQSYLLPASEKDKIERLNNKKYWQEIEAQLMTEIDLIEDKKRTLSDAIVENKDQKVRIEAQITSLKSKIEEQNVKKKGRITENETLEGKVQNEMLKIEKEALKIKELDRDIAGINNSKSIKTQISLTQSKSGLQVELNLLEVELIQVNRRLSEKEGRYKSLDFAKAKKQELLQEAAWRNSEDGGEYYKNFYSTEQEPLLSIA